MMNKRFGHRCYEHSTRGKIVYDPQRSRPLPWSAVIELDDEIGRLARWHFQKRHGVQLLKPSYPAHLSLFRGPDEYVEGMERVWGALEGDQVEVHYTQELFWKGGFVWLNAYCKEYFTLRETLLGMDHSDNELWGHITIGQFAEGEEMPRFMDYHDLYDWRSHP